MSRNTEPRAGEGRAEELFQGDFSSFVLDSLPSAWTHGCHRYQCMPTYDTGMHGLSYLCQYLINYHTQTHIHTQVS